MATKTSQFQYTTNQFYAQSVWKKSYLKEVISESYLSKTFNSLKEVTLVMMGLHAPPIIREHIEGAQYDDKERCRPLGLETNSYHDTGHKAHERYQQT